MSEWLRTVGLIFILLWMSGCSSGPKKKPETSLQLAIHADQIINTDGDAEASPVQLRLYELKSTELFNQADFLDLFNNDTAVLQSTLVSKHYLPTIWPGMSKTLTFNLNPETTSVAVVGEFARYLSATTKASSVITAGKSNQMKLTIEDNRILLQPERAELNFLPQPLATGLCCE